MALEASGPLQKQLDNNLMIESLLGGDKNRETTLYLKLQLHSTH